MPCTARHTQYQPPIEAWLCPDCGKGPKDKPQGFVTDEQAHGSDGCTLLHEEDWLACYACDYAISGRSWAWNLQQVMDLVPCKHCKGTGLVKRE